MANNCDFLPLLSSVLTTKQARELNPLVLAYIGDSVHMLFVRSKFALNSNHKANMLHNIVSKEVKASAQASLMDTIMPLLTEEESDIFRRARNSHTNNIAKNATVADYKKASGFEALVGYLYVTGQHERLLSLLGSISDNKE